MANKQTLPNLSNTQRTYIETSGAPKVPQISFQSDWKDASQALAQTNTFLTDYTELKYRQFQAGLQNLEFQQFHEMQDAVDPCQLEEINQKYAKAYASQYKDEPWGKSYYQSEAYRLWNEKHKINQQEVYLRKQHEFSAIQLERTLNEMSSAAALADSPQEIDRFFVNGVNLVGNWQHLDVNTKNKLQNYYAQKLVEKVYTTNPNKAVALGNAVGSKYDKYGVDFNAVRKDAENWNIQQRNLQLRIEAAERAKLKAQEDEQLKQNKNKVADTLISYKSNEITLDDVLNEVQTMRQTDPVTALNLLNAVTPDEDSESAKKIVQNQIGNLANDFLIERDDLTPEEQTARLSEINTLLISNQNRGLLSESYVKSVRGNLGIKDEEQKFDIEPYISDAKFGDLTNSQENELRSAVAREELKSESLNQILTMNQENLGISGYKNQIIKGQITSNEDIEALALPQEATVILKEYLQDFQSKHKIENQAMHKAWSNVVDWDLEDLNNFFSKNKDLTISQKEQIKSWYKDTIPEKQLKNAVNLFNNLGEITPSRISSEYLKGNITAGQRDSLLELKQNKDNETYQNSYLKISEEILDRKITTEQQLNQRLKDLPQTSDFTTNVKKLRTLFSDMDAPYQDLLKTFHTYLEDYFQKNPFSSISQEQVYGLEKALRFIDIQFEKAIQQGNSPEVLKNSFSAEYLNDIAKKFSEDAKRGKINIETYPSVEIKDTIRSRKSEEQIEDYVLRQD